MNELNQKILQWAYDKNILKNRTSEGQMRKVLEEYRETAEAIAFYHFIAEASPVLAERALERELNEAKKMIEDLKKLEYAQNTLRLIAIADWKTSGELRKMARDAWEKGSNND